jgi:hypothetical protein
VNIRSLAAHASWTPDANAKVSSLGFACEHDTVRRGITGRDAKREHATGSGRGTRAAQSQRAPT